MAPSMVCALSRWWPLPGHLDIVNTLCDIQELSVLQSVDWGAVAFSIVLVELERHILRGGRSCEATVEATSERHLTILVAACAAEVVGFEATSR